ncbi:5-hydroxytryptamine receptor-like [Eriocheir sinensis]|uniref:5-hydroxytryptamine receptor-like n=1 Tax=Eriocheir sinensis TaxID=95602 RepID=UPI0021C7032F|nr:5-hydroxytryptamine receptor-like [Eriocheir sinensis]
MGRENTTSDDWNYTLPNLMEVLLEAGSGQGHGGGGGGGSGNPILQDPSKEPPPTTTLWGTPLTPTPPPTPTTPTPSTTTTTPPPINKPIFPLNFTLRTTIGTLLRSRPNLTVLEPFTAGSGTPLELEASPGALGMLGPSSELVLAAGNAGNDSLVSLDDSFWLSGGNESWNVTRLLYGNETSDGPLVDTAGMVVTSVILGVMILTTVIGNVFVIAAILLERNLQQVANFLIVSLAVADLMVACLVMPLGAVYEISREWILGPELCDMWTSSDVLCCTASILHLVAIALDRYWAVTQVDYIHSRNGTRIGLMILMVWLTAVVVSIAPLFGWKDPDFLVRVNEHKKCLVSQDLAYQVFATMATFYVPLTAILILYWKIFQAARKRIHKSKFGGKEAKQKKNINKGKNKGAKEPTTAATTTAPTAPAAAASGTSGAPPSAAGGSGGAAGGGDHKTTIRPNGVADHQQTTAFTTVASGASPDKSSNNGALSVCSHVSEVSRLEMLPKEAPKKSKKETLEAKREKKAAKTLAIITGAFVICWLPFFVTALLMPICPACYFSDVMFSIFLWLGYFNSTLNPIIYTIFSPEFREAFKRILFGRKNQRYRPGKIR